MRALKIMAHVSLDGVLQTSGADSDSAYGDWTAPYRTPEGRDAVLAAHGENFDLLLGRRTYDAWSEAWGKAPPSSMANAINGAKKYVVTHRPESLAWGPYEALGPDFVEGLRSLKARGGSNLVLWGSTTLASTLLEHGLADEILLLIYPILLGTGKRFFVDGTPPRTFELASTTATPSGILVCSYTAAGPLKTG